MTWHVEAKDAVTHDGRHAKFIRHDMAHWPEPWVFKLDGVERRYGVGGEVGNHREFETHKMDLIGPWLTDAPKANRLQALDLKPLEWSPLKESVENKGVWVTEANAFGVRWFYQISGCPDHWLLRVPGLVTHVYHDNLETIAIATRKAEEDRLERIRAEIKP